MKTLTVSQARGSLGRLVDDAFKAKSVFIRHRDRVVQLVPTVVPDPIPAYAPGAIEMPEDRLQFINSMPDDSKPLNR
jgi:hypothetical protein